MEMGAPPEHFPKIAGLLAAPKVNYPHGTQPPEISGMLIAETATGHSFPSGHAANNMAVATVLILFYPRRGWIYLPIALAICYARIYTGSHWPLDVAVGIILGVVGGRLAVWLILVLWRQWGNKILPNQFAQHPDLLHA